MKNNSSLARKALAYMLTLFLLFGIASIPGIVNQVCATENIRVKIEQTGGYFATQGDKGVPLKVRVTNNSGGIVSFNAVTGLSQSSGALTEPNLNEGIVTLNDGQSTELIFSINVSNTAAAETHMISIILIDMGAKSGEVLRSKTVSMQISKKSTVPPSDYSGNYLPAADLTHSLSPGDAIMAGVNNELTLSFSNKGNTLMKDTKVTLVLPEGISINNASSSLSVGYISIGDMKTVVFPLTADTDLESRNYPITVRISFYDYGNNAQSIEQTLYIPVQATGRASIDNVAITEINLPRQAASGDDFTLSFRVENRGTGDTGKLKIYTEAPEGLANRTQNVFLESGISKGNGKAYSVTYFSQEEAAEKNYPIKIVVEPASGKDGEGIFQYAGVFIKRVGSGTIKTPQLMVSDYSYGGTFVQAGDEFRLHLGLNNTSASHDLQNIKVTLDSSDGTFIPVQSSNSFYIDQIGRKETVGYSLYLSVKPDAPQKTTSVNVTMSYEDSSGNGYTSTDIISIPVMQETRLVVDDIIPPPELYTGMQNGVNIQFYNMGKTTLNNLRIRADGDFDTMESSSYYVGNMEPGVSDSYNFSFIPRNTGLMEGKVIFSYEDASGNEQVYEKEFGFEIIEMPFYPEEPYPIDGEETEKVPWIPIVIGIAVLGAGGGYFIFRRRRRKKIHEELEIDE
ncbi:MAG: hypothetical protein PHR60_02860 [Eubacteriales bacterium]|nr:hypothetical protein [Eubacteriales bacterium]MDD4583113.1 hypothetical protein [Eubacteriales bacterium]